MELWNELGRELSQAVSEHQTSVTIWFIVFVLIIAIVKAIIDHITFSPIYKKMKAMEKRIAELENKIADMNSTKDGSAKPENKETVTEIDGIRIIEGGDLPESLKFTTIEFDPNAKD